MCKLSFKLFTGYRSKLELTTKCQLSVTTSSLTHLLPVSMTFSLCTPLPGNSFFRTHTDNSYPPCYNKNLGPTPFPLLCSRAMELSLSLLTSFTFHSPMPSNCVKNSPLQTIPEQMISNSVFLFAPPPLVTFLMCARGRGGEK